MIIFSCFFFFFKQKSAYDMRISDWSSDVCSSDLSKNPNRAEERGESAQWPFRNFRDRNAATHFVPTPSRRWDRVQERASPTPRRHRTLLPSCERRIWRSKRADRHRRGWRQPEGVAALAFLLRPEPAFHRSEGGRVGTGGVRTVR